MVRLTYFNKEYCLPGESSSKVFKCAIICELAKALKAAPANTTPAEWRAIRRAAVDTAYKTVTERKKQNGKKAQI